MISIFDLFKIGLGPSSSCTLGAMRAAAAFSAAHLAGCQGDPISRVQARLSGPMVQHWKACASDKAVTLGLSGCAPDATDPDMLDIIWASIQETRRLRTSNGREIDFDPVRDIIVDTTAERLVQQNALRFTAIAADGRAVADEVWHCVSGGLIFREGEQESNCFTSVTASYPFWSAATLREMCRKANGTVADVVRANELSLRDSRELREYIGQIADAMLACIDRGLNASGELPGVDRVKRRARSLHQQCGRNQPHSQYEITSRVISYAVATSEENASGSRVVTAPTHRTSGIVPAVLRYYLDYRTSPSADGTEAFLLTATAIGVLFRTSISTSVEHPAALYKTAVACSMAAGSLAAALGATYQQVENAAHLAVVKCLPPVNWPESFEAPLAYIDDNAGAAVVAVEAASLARHGDHPPLGSLDETIAAMRRGANPVGSLARQ
jgi:L-serine dehydratase